MISTGRFSRRAARMMRSPGSEIQGIPESVTRAMVWPERMRSRISISREASLNFW